MILESAIVTVLRDADRAATLALNDFDSAPLKTEKFDGMEIRGGEITLHLPACSVAEIRLSC